MWGGGRLAAIVDFEHVTVARGSQIVLHDINLRIEPGEHLAILGPNGCGKSTLLKTITCELYPLARPDMRVRLIGRERWDLTQLKRLMGVVSADVPGRQTRGCTGEEAVLTGFFSSSTLWPNLTVTAEMRDKVSELLALVGGETLRGKLVGEMSAGQQRRVMIARAMAGTSLQGSVQMLLLDEPSNALDLAAQRDLRETLRRLAQAGTAIVLITHHIEDILPDMRRVVMMADGRIVADGAKVELLTAERLSGLFGGSIQLQESSGWYKAW